MIELDVPWGRRGPRPAFTDHDAGKYPAGPHRMRPEVWNLPKRRLTRVGAQCCSYGFTLCTLAEAIPTFLGSKVPGVAGTSRVGSFPPEAATYGACH